MQEIDKSAFGAFLTELRKEKGWTQKDLAEKLLISDKAVSKWERGLSLPDIAMLMPLAETLGVTVTELLEGRRMEDPAPMERSQVEELVQKALTLNEEEKTMLNKKHLAVFAGGLAAVALEWLVLWKLTGEPGIAYPGLNVLEGIAIGFGFYFWLFMKERLPDYYDQNQIGSVSDGIFRMNVPGVAFNNGNWPVIVKALRLWSLITMVAVPLLSLGLMLLPESLALAGQMGALALFLGSLFVPVVVLGRKYDAQRVPGREKKSPWMYLVILGLVLLLTQGNGRSGVRIGFVERSGGDSWSASYVKLDGSLRRTMRARAEGEPFLLCVTSKGGELAITIRDDTGLVFDEGAVQTGEYPLVLKGRASVLIRGENHKGSFQIEPAD